MNILFTFKSIEGEGSKVHIKIVPAFHLFEGYTLADIQEKNDYHNAFFWYF